MTLASTVVWIHGVCLSVFDQRHSARWKSFNQLVSSARAALHECLLSSTAAFSAYLPFAPCSRVGNPLLLPRPSRGEQGRVVSWVVRTTDVDVQSESSDGADEASDDESSSSLADSVHSLQEFLVSENAEEGGQDLLIVRRYASESHVSLTAKQPLRLLPASPLDHVEHVLLQRMKIGGFQLPRHLFVGAMSNQKQRHQSRSCTKQEQQSWHRASTGSFSDAQLLEYMHPQCVCTSMSPGLPLLLPAPIFLPQALGIGLFCEKGHRTHNEDMAFAMQLDPMAHAASCFHQAVCWGLFDGHGGVEVAAHLTECFPDIIAKRCNDIKEQGVAEVATIMLGLEVDLLSRYHQEWLPGGRDPGSTALVAAVMDDSLMVANVGDCRLLLISEAVDSLGNRTAFVAKATCDHHCARNPHEARRIRDAGAHVDEAGYIGSMLEVSRSIGDFHTKGELGCGVIISEPEVYTWQLGPQDLLAVAVTDGISGSMDDMEICNMVCKLLNEKKHLNDPVYAARELSRFAAFAKQSSDNCSAVVVVLKDQPPPQPARRRLFDRK